MSLINNYIPASYIMGSVTQIQVAFESNAATSIKIRNISVLDVQLKTTTEPKK